MSNKLIDEPILTLKKNIIQLELYNTVIWPKINKRVNLGDNNLNTTLMGYQYSKDKARLRIVLNKSQNLK